LEELVCTVSWKLWRDRDHDLVGGERRQRVGDCLQRISVADAALCAGSATLEEVDDHCGTLVRLDVS
jgi:hypothetical protein